MLYDGYTLKNIQLKNRVVMPPMCMYSANQQGEVNNFHIVHYGTRALGGVGLIIQEATGIMPNGRITDQDLGIWDDHHVKGLKKIVEIIHEHGSVAGIQINHAGRKAKVDHPIGPSAITYGGDYATPQDDLKRYQDVVKAFGQAARRANEAGYDLLEIHGAHGYLLFQFLSPLSNKRTDQ
jgi:NADPH2 dehydrogenase